MMLGILLIFLFLINLLKIYTINEEKAENLYPIVIDELGDFKVNEPILPAHFFNFPVEQTSQYKPFKIDQDPRDIRVHNFCPTESMAGRFFARNTFDLHYGHLIRDKIDRSHARILANRIMKFNSCLLPIDFTEEQAYIFGSVFFRLFVASFPGLKGVPLSKSDIVSLLFIATGMAMNSSEHRLFSLDFFFIKAVSFLYPSESSQISYGYHFTYQNLSELGCEYSLSASFEIHLRKLVNRSVVLLDQLGVDQLLCSILYDEPAFLYLLSTIEDIKSIYFGPFVDDHIALYAIKYGFFHGEILLRPELKDFYFPRFYDDNDDQLLPIFTHFYSLALYIAISFKNVQVIKFILQLEYFDYFPMIENENTENPICISELLFLQLRALFLFTSFDHRDIITLFPDISYFYFCEFDLNSLIEMFSADFPALIQLEKYLIPHI